ncbi:hypothetical protein TorRG33x02_324920 [Trema orientale]|uniref:Uncharacterized protein n=1 Tax=Trema orientale TaxID=63057 RepID=A0A2P5BDF7_TREOI|nr:hypothetical protein TorRG33x02_324920 [Trema orientale]
MIPKCIVIISTWPYHKKHGDVDDDTLDYDYAPAACLGDDNDDAPYYDYAPAATIDNQCDDGDDDDDAPDYDYAPAASMDGLACMRADHGFKDI